MYRYIAFGWDPRDADAVGEAGLLEDRLLRTSTHRWSRVWRRDGFSLFDSGAGEGRPRSLSLPGGAGVILGCIFRGCTPITTGLCDQDAEGVAASGGRALAERFWGRYVAFLQCPSSGALNIVRDPTGGLPCLTAASAKLRIVFSDMQDVSDLEHLKLTIDWRSLGANILAPQLQRSRTGLNEVDEILPGERRTLDKQRMMAAGFLWDPFAIARDELTSDSSEAADLLRGSVRDAVGALSSGFSRVGVNLGGLDSSITLACLAASRKCPQIVALNYFTPDPRGDERHFARETAQRYSAALIENELDPTANLGLLKISNKLARPPGMFDYIGLSSNPSANAARHGAQALFTGLGGDSLFCQPPVNLSASDYARKRGFDGGFFSAALDAARYGRVTLGRTLLDAARERLSPEPSDRFVLDMLYGKDPVRFLNSDFTQSCNRFEGVNPMLGGRSGEPKSKLVQIVTSAFFQADYYDHWDTAYSLEKIPALLQQPIIETCLRIPPWVMIEGGYDRALARRAFSAMLPYNVVRRPGKSTPASYYEGLCRNNRMLIAGALMDGVLAQAGVIDRSALEAPFARDAPLANDIAYDLLSLFGIEIWAQGWVRSSIHTRPLQAA